jgi:imidazolonepropionase-like amidohydrolase
MTAERLLKPWKPEPQKTYVFRNANVVDPVDGSILPNSTVKISGGLVESVTKTEKDYVVVAKDKEIAIDLEGKYLCPGLIDNHVHISAVPGEKNLGDIYGLDKDVSQMRQPYVCQQMLRRGFTSVRDCGGALLPLKEAINDGVIQGPRLFIVGHALTQTGGHGDVRGPHNHTDCCGGTVMALGRLCDGVPECIKAAREGGIEDGCGFHQDYGGRRCC